MSNRTDPRPDDEAREGDPGSGGLLASVALTAELEQADPTQKEQQA